MVLILSVGGYVMRAKQMLFVHTPACSWQLNSMGTQRVADTCRSVLLIVADDMQPQDVGALRSTTAPLLKAKRARHLPRSLRTPALDSLVEHGVAVARAYSPHAMCTPARAAILTGRLQSRNANVVWRARNRTGRHRSAQLDAAYASGRVAPHVDFGAVLGGQPTTLASGLRSAGFATGMFGKWHVHGWSTALEQRLCAGGGRRVWTASSLEEVQSAVRSAGFDDVGALYPCNLPAAGAYTHNLDWIVERTQLFMEAARERRWFAYVGLTLLHSPFAWKALQAQTPRMPFQGPGSPGPLAAKLRNQSRALVAQALEMDGLRPLEHEGDASSSWDRHYLAGLLWIDHSVGALLEALVERGAETDTLVVFTSDHGREGKYSCYEHGIRVPLVFRWPAGIGRGVVLRDELASHVDLMPTLFAAAGLGHVNSGDGRSLLPVLQRGVARGARRRQRVFCETYFDRAAIGLAHKLVWRRHDPHRAIMARGGAQAYREPRAWNSSALQLYNLSADPYERDNLLLTGDTATGPPGRLQLRDVRWLWRALQSHVNETDVFV